MAISPCDLQNQKPPRASIQASVAKKHGRVIDFPLIAPAQPRQCDPATNSTLKSCNDMVLVVQLTALISRFRAMFALDGKTPNLDR